MEQHQTSPQPLATLPATSPAPHQSTALTGSIRHDGWTGEKMAIFCETLADTAVVAEACEAAGMGLSGAYPARRRNPVFAAAWDAALTIARDRLADTLLARSMEGNVEQIWKDGELVGERHVLDNRLGLALLRRLDRLAETGLSTSRRGERAATAPAPRPHGVDWEMMVGALRTGDPDDIAAALAMLKSNEVDEVEGPPVPLNSEEEDDGLDLSERCWWDQREECWMTDFPPPAGFTGYESRPYDSIDDDDDEPYVRGCSEEEVAILEADAAAGRAEQRAEDEALRDEWFALLRAECSEADAKQRPSSTKSRAEPASGSRSEPD
jgi:hypothetical protein